MYSLALSLSALYGTRRRGGMKKGRSGDDRAPFMLLNCSRHGEILHRPGSVAYFRIEAWTPTNFGRSLPTSLAYLGALSQLSFLKRFHHMFTFRIPTPMYPQWFIPANKFGMCQQDFLFKTLLSALLQDRRKAHNECSRKQQQKSFSHIQLCFSTLHATKKFHSRMWNGARLILKRVRVVHCNLNAARFKERMYEVGKCHIFWLTWPYYKCCLHLI